jgi:murein tripeptide amidase MpaA
LAGVLTALSYLRPRNYKRNYYKVLYIRAIYPTERSADFQNCVHVQINSYLRELAEKYPDLVSVESVGLSYENRDMLLIKISAGGAGHRPAVLVDGGIHAREWIAPAMALYIIHQLVEHNDTSSDLIDGVDWLILPVLNPDGYEYSHNTVRNMAHSHAAPKTSTFGIRLIKMYTH